MSKPLASDEHAGLGTPTTPLHVSMGYFVRTCLWAQILDNRLALCLHLA